MLCDWRPFSLGSKLPKKFEISGPSPSPTRKDFQRRPPPKRRAFPSEEHPEVTDSKLPQNLLNVLDKQKVLCQEVLEAFSIAQET